MKAPLMAAVARMPARQLNMLLAGVLAIVLALLWTFALRAPLAALRLQRAERARMELAAGQPARTAQQLAALSAQVGALERALGRDGGAGSQLQLRLIGEVDRAAARHGVLLRSAAPGPARTVATFTETSIDVEAAGSYRALVAWLREIDAGAGPLSIVSFDLRAGDGAAQRIIKIRLAAYLPPKEQP